jgi:hypothetical protein
MKFYDKHVLGALFLPRRNIRQQDEIFDLPDS